MVLRAIRNRDAHSPQRSTGAVCVLVVLAGCGMARAQSAKTPPANDAPPPHLVIFLIDTLRSDRVGAYGYDKPTTPVIDALAADGVVFERAASPAPWTLPTVVSLMTSTYPCEHGVVKGGQKLTSKIPPLALRLRKHHYACCSLYANAWAGPTSGLHRGFQLLQPTAYADARIVEPYLDKMRGHPMFIYIHNVEPHDPHATPEEIVAQFGDVPADVKQRVRELYYGYRSLTRVDAVNKRPIGTTDNTEEQAAAMAELTSLRDHINVLYDASVRQADTRVGEVIELLKRRGFWDNTIFVVLADHGEELGDHGGWQHDQSVYDELVHVPLIIRFPNNAHAGVRVKHNVSLIDLLPTLAEAMSMPDLADDARGASLMPLIRNAATTADRATRVTSIRMNETKYYKPFKTLRGDVNIVVRRGPWKFIWNVEPDTMELYDLATDPGETQNVVGGNVGLAQELRQFAEDWHDSCGEDAAAPVPGDMDAIDDDALKSLKALGYVD